MSDVRMHDISGAATGGYQAIFFIAVFLGVDLELLWEPSLTHARPHIPTRGGVSNESAVHVWLGVRLVQTQSLTIVS